MSEVQLNGNVKTYGAVKIVHGADLEVTKKNSSFLKVR